MSKSISDQLLTLGVVSHRPSGRELDQLREIKFTPSFYQARRRFGFSGVWRYKSFMYRDG